MKTRLSATPTYWRPPGPVRQPATARCYSGGLPAAADRRWELGATGHGPTGAELAGRICDQIAAWDRDRSAHTVISACPAGALAG